MSTPAESNLPAANSPGLPGASAAPSIPTTTTISARVTKRRRSAKFWLILSGIILLLAPLLLFLAMLIYIRAGMMNGFVSNQVSELFGVRARVGSVTTRLLDNLQIENVQVDPTNAGKPLTVDAIHLDWDYGPMLSSGRIRSLRIEHPALDLRRFNDGQWNFSIKPSQSNESNGQIEQFLVQNGDLTVTTDKTQITHVKDLYASFTNTGRLVPRAFTLRGKLESAEVFSVTGSFGPGENLTANASGATVLDQDWPVLSPVKGKLSYELSCRREVTADQKTSLPLKLSGRIDMEQFQWPVAGGVDADLSNHNLQFQSTLAWPGDEKPPLLTGSKVTLDQLGTLALDKIVVGPDACNIENGTATIDLAALKALFKLPAAQDAYAVLGTVRASNIALTLPARDQAALRASGDLAAPDARIRLPGIGELPPIAVQGHLDWPAVTSAKVSIGSALNAAFQVNDLRPDPWGQNEAPWASVAAQTKLQELSVDIGQLMQSDAGRRLLFGLSQRNRPIPPDLPVSFEGILSAKNVRPELAHGVDGRSGVTISGLQIRDLTLNRWPLPLRIPTIVMSGDVTALLGCDRDFGPVALSGKIAEVLPKQLPPSSALTGEFAIAFGSDERGIWRPKPLKISRLTIPWAALNRIVNLTEMFGISMDGKVTITDAVVDTNTGDLSMHVDLNSPSLIFPIPDQLQPMVVNALRSARYTISAAALEAIPITTAKLTNFSASIDVKVVNGLLTVAGATHRGTLNVKPPTQYVPDVALVTFPDLEFTYAQPLAPTDSSRAYALTLKWLRTNALKLDVHRSTDDAWKVQGDFQSQATGGKVVNFSGAFEPLKALVGPLSISMSSLDAGELNAISAAISPKREAIPNPAYGEIQNVKFEMQPLSLRGSPLNKPLNARITGKFVGFGAKINAWDRVELSGPLVCILSFANGTLGLNSLVTLENYGALLGGGRIMIPPPPPGRSGSLKLAGKFGQLPDNGGTQFQIENFDLNLAGQVLASADGVIANDGVEPVSEIRIEHFRVVFPDLKESGRTYLQANLELAGSRLDALNLAGTAALTGEYMWSDSGRSRLLANLNPRHADATFAQPPPLSIHDASGDIPIFLRSGTWRDTEKLEQRGTLAFGSFEAGATKLENKKFDLIATPNALKLSAPLPLVLPGGLGFTLESLDLESLSILAGIPHSSEPKSADVVVPNANPAAPVDLNVESPAIRVLGERRAARALKLNVWKQAGTLGEGSGGLLEVHVAPALPLPELKLMRNTVTAENDDRAALFEALQKANGLPDAERSRVINAFARRERESAGPEDWVRSPRDGKWVQRKTLE